MTEVAMVRRVTDYRVVTAAEWRHEIPRRAVQWELEDRVAAAEREAQAREAQQRRAAEWDLARIRAVMAGGS